MYVYGIHGLIQIYNEKTFFNLAIVAEFMVNSFICTVVLTKIHSNYHSI